MAESEKTEEQTPKEAPAQTAPAPAPEKKGKAGKVIGLIVVLIIVLGIIFVVVFYGEELFGDMFKPTTTTTTGEGEPIADMINVGTPGATSTLNEEGATETAIEEGFETGEEIVYVFCEELGPGDKIGPEGEAAEYEVDGPVWFSFVDEEPQYFYEHDVKYIFIDASTGEKTVYEESWPPEINGKLIHEAAEDCGGLRKVQAV